MAATVRDLAWEAGTVVGVPFVVMWGVVNIETSAGANISTSSAGAKGLYQFIQSTAADPRWHYPWVNSGRPETLAAQALGAARYLHALRAERGSWDAALRAYSGGGYGLGDVERAASNAGGGLRLVYPTSLGARGTPPATPLAGLTGSARAGTITVSTQGNPTDRSPKIRVTGRQMGEHGTSFGGHALAVRNLRNRHVTLRT